MPIPSRLSNYLEQQGVRYTTAAHPHSRTSAETARMAHVEPHRLAKAVIVEDDEGRVVAAVLPADRSVSLRDLSRLLGREHLRLVDENRIAALFADCDRGAVPALGMAWGIETVVDDQLEAADAVYIEAGDHECLVHMAHDAFHTLMSTARHGQFCGDRIH